MAKLSTVGLCLKCLDRGNGFDQSQRQCGVVAAFGIAMVGCWGRGTGAGAGGGAGTWGSAVVDPGRSGSEFSGFFVVVISLKRGVVVSVRMVRGGHIISNVSMCSMVTLCVLSSVT
jgi:hypothetical protein